MSVFHFLDANILIGSRIDWDPQHEFAVGYLDINGFNRHTSLRTFNEARNVFQRNRRIILKFFHQFYEEFAGITDIFRIDQKIGRFRRVFEDKEHLNDKEKYILENFINRNMNELRSVVMGGEYEFGEFKTEIAEAFETAIDSLDFDCLSDPTAKIIRYDECPLPYDPRYHTEYTRLIDLIEYQNDVYILLDSFFIRNEHITQDVCFITTDSGHILSKKQDIERILQGIRFSHPSRYLH